MHARVEKKLLSCFSSWREKKGSNVRAEGLQQGWQEQLKLEKEGTIKEQQWVGESLQRVATGLFKVTY